MQILAHRGYHASLPENTLEAFAAAMSLGCDGIETDVRLSADQVLVLFHDRVVQGVAVSSLTQRELSERCGYAVPSLAAALQAFPLALWNIEIKTTAAAGPALALLQQYQASHRLLITSFRHDVVVQAAQQLEVACGWLNAHRPLDAASFLQAALPYPRLRTLVWDAEIVDAALLAASKQLGFNNAVYSPKTQEEHLRLREWAVDLVITDYPQFAGLNQ